MCGLTTNNVNFLILKKENIDTKVIQRDYSEDDENVGTDVGMFSSLFTKVIPALRLSIQPLQVQFG